MTDRRVPAFGIVEALNIVEHISSGFVSGSVHFARAKVGEDMAEFVNPDALRCGAVRRPLRGRYDPAVEWHAQTVAALLAEGALDRKGNGWCPRSWQSCASRGLLQRWQQV